MRLAIFGGSGRVGRVLVKKALEEGHDVTVLIREPDRFEVKHHRLSVLKGNVLNAVDTSEAVNGQDAVVCVLGDGRKGKIRTAGTRVIIDAMKKNGVKRLICQSSLGVGDSVDTLNFFWKYVMFGAFLRAAFADHVNQEELVAGSGLNWTIVRPAAFTEGGATGSYLHGTLKRKDGLLLKISCSDIAGFILSQIDSDEYLRKTPGLSYSKTVNASLSVKKEVVKAHS
jgi:putative NADH-flavin reductase